MHKRSTRSVPPNRGTFSTSSRCSPGARTVVLCTNYRSGQQILDVANAIGSEAPEGFSAVLHAASSQPGMRPRLVRCADEDSQTAAVCDQILAHREEGIELKEQAVLVRAHSSLEPAGARARTSKDSVRQVRRPAICRSSSCQGLARRRFDSPTMPPTSWRGSELLQLMEGVGPTTARRAISALGVADSDGDPLSQGEVMARWPGAAQLLPESSRLRADTLAAALISRDDEGLPAHAERFGSQ